MLAEFGPSLYVADGPTVSLFRLPVLNAHGSGSSFRWQCVGVVANRPD